MKIPDWGWLLIGGIVVWWLRQNAIAVAQNTQTLEV